MQKKELDINFYGDEEDEPLIDALMDPTEQAVLRFPERYYSFRRGVKGLKTDPKGFSNKRFLEKNPEYKEIADNWNKFKENLIEYEMKDPTTGKILPHVAYKNLPKELREELNKEVGQRSGHFGHMGFFKANKYPKKRFSEQDQLPYTEWVGRYEDKFGSERTVLVCILSLFLSTFFFDNCLI